MKINNNYILLLCVAALALFSLMSIRGALTQVSDVSSASSAPSVADTSKVLPHNAAAGTNIRH